MNLIKRKIIEEFLEYCANREYEVKLKQWDEYGPYSGGEPWVWVDEDALIEEFFKELEEKVMNDFNDWKEVKEYLEHSQDPDDFTTIRAYGVTGYWSKSFRSWGDMNCCWEDFQSVEEAIEDFQIHCKDITKVYKDD